jgi:hypothetical protein
LLKVALKHATLADHKRALAHPDISGGRYAMQLFRATWLRLCDEATKQWHAHQALEVVPEMAMFPHEMAQLAAKRAQERYFEARRIWALQHGHMPRMRVARCGAESVDADGRPV